MSDPTAPEFGGTDEELEKYLLEFARTIGGGVLRDPNRGGWRVFSGSRLSTNPNTIPCSLRVFRENGRIAIEPQGRFMPWTRAKAGRIAAFRRGQLADFLAMRARGAGRESLNALRLREPFASFGSGPAALTASFAWSTVCGVVAMAAALVAMTIAAMPLMGVAIAEILDRARVVQAAGGVALPPPDRPLSLLGAAFVFAVPLAFLGALVHVFALAASEIWFRADRLPQASFLFVAFLLTVAFFPFLPLLALPLAIGVPLAIHAGYTAVWGRRRERVREGSRPRKGVVVAGALLAALVLSTLLPLSSDQREWTDRLALFRDRFMLGNPLGKSAAEVYYRHTLVGAELSKRFYSTDPSLPVRLLRTAFAEDPDAVDDLRKKGFTVSRDSAAKVDVRIPKGGKPTPESLDALAKESFRGTWLRQVTGLAWQSLYYAGPIVVALFLVGAFCPAVSILFRVFRPRVALAALGIVFLLSAGIVISSLTMAPGAWETLQSLRTEPGPKPIAAALASPSAVVRHEAAFQAFRHPDESLGEPLLKAADDDDVRVRLWACAALGKTGHPDALAKLIARLHDPELFVRYRAAEGLGFLKQRRAIEPLLKMTREGIWYEGHYALESLRMLDSAAY